MIIEFVLRHPSLITIPSMEGEDGLREEVGEAGIARTWWKPHDELEVDGVF